MHSIRYIHIPCQTHQPYGEYGGANLLIVNIYENVKSMGF